MSLVNKYFDDNIAKQYGVDEAIMFRNIQFWCEQNKLNNGNLHDGKYWTYNTAKAYNELFTFWTPKQIQRILKNLEKNELILVNNYNKAKFDKTKWYTINSEKMSINSDFTKRSNRIAQTVKPIPYNKLSISKDIDEDKSSLEFKKQFLPIGYDGDTITSVQKFYDLVHRNFPYIKDRREELDKIESDYKAFDKLVKRIDNITTITKIIDWCQKDKFWKMNIKRINVLIRKFDDLMVKSGITPPNLKEIYNGKIDALIKLNSSLCNLCDKGYIIKNINGYDKAVLCSCSLSHVNKLKQEYESKKSSLSSGSTIHS